LTVLSNAYSDVPEFVVVVSNTRRIAFGDARMLNFSEMVDSVVHDMT